MKNLFTCLSKKSLSNENGPMMDRQWTDEVAEKSARMSTVWAMLWVKLVNLVNFVMQIFKLTKLTKLTKWTEQICAESLKSLKSLKSLMQIFATSATFASANFVSKAFCESTVRYREWSRIPSCYLRYSLDSHLSRLCLASLICLCMLTVGVGNAWGAVYTYDFTSITTSDWTQTSGSAISAGTNYASFVCKQSGVNGHTFTGGTGTNYMFKNENISGSYYKFFFLGKTDAAINLPSYDAPVSKVTITKLNASYGGNPTVNIFAGASAASDASTVSTSGTDFSISSTYQSSDLTIKVTSNANIAFVTIEVTTIDAAHKVTLKDDDTELEEASPGAGVILPSREGCAEYEFAGWSISDCGDEWITSPKPTIIEAGSYHPADDVDLYPVYISVDDKGICFSKYEKVTLGGTITAGKYLISTGSYTMAGDGNSGASFSPGKTEATDYEYTVAVLANSVLTICGPDGNYIGGTSGSTTLSFSTSTPSDNNYKWKYTSSGINFQGQTTRYIKPDGTTCWKNYASASDAAFYKRIEADRKDTSYIAVPNCCDPLGGIDGPVSFTKTAYTITATWPTTEDGNETGYSVQLYDNNGSGAKGSAIGDPVAITGTAVGNRTCTFGAKTPAGSRLTANYQYFIGVTPTYSGAGDYCSTGTEVVGNTTTDPVYTVTYANGGGSGTMTDSNSPYEAGDAVTVLTNTFTKPGYPFDSWSAVDASSNVIDVSSGSFTMPSSNVTITATWGAALQDEFLDKEHGNSRATRSGANKETPSLSNFTPVNEYCADLHYKFIGWVLSTSVNDDGTLKNDAVVVPGGQGSWNCTGSTYYAVWAAENK